MDLNLESKLKSYLMHGYNLEHYFFFIFAFFFLVLYNPVIGLTSVSYRHMGKGEILLTGV